MKNQVNYEWDMELADNPFVDAAGDIIADIIDHDFADKLKDLKDPHPPRDGEHHRLVLVRSTGNEDEGVIDRQWAYLDDAGNLPAVFDYGAKVPKRFHREFETQRGWASKMIEPGVKE